MMKVAIVGGGLVSIASSMASAVNSVASPTVILFLGIKISLFQ